MLKVNILRRLRGDNVGNLLRVVPPGKNKPFLPRLIFHVDIPQLVTELVIAVLDQKGRLHDKHIGVLALLMGNLFSDLILHRRMYDGVHRLKLLGIIEDNPGQAVSVKLALFVEDRLPEMLHDGVKALAAFFLHLFGNQICLAYRRPVLVVQILKNLRLPCAYSSGNSNHFHALSPPDIFRFHVFVFPFPSLRLIPVLACMHINLKRHQKVRRLLHLFLKHPLHSLKLRLPRLYKKFVVHLQNQP